MVTHILKIDFLGEEKFNVYVYLVTTPKCIMVGCTMYMNDECEYNIEIKWILNEFKLLFMVFENADSILKNCWHFY